MGYLPIRAPIAVREWLLQELLCLAYFSLLVLMAYHFLATRRLLPLEFYLMADEALCLIDNTEALCKHRGDIIQSIFAHV